MLATRGKQFEKQVDDLLLQTRYQLYKENKKLNGSRIDYGIDQLLYTNDKIIIVQDKWRVKKPDSADAQRFTAIIDKYERLYPNKKIYGIYITRTNPTKNMVSWFNQHKKEIYNVYSIDDTMESALINLHRLLHTLGIYLYDYDDCVIMAIN